jgi:diguanylate cyclase (GGDEF)-like protein
MAVRTVTRTSQLNRTEQAQFLGALEDAARAANPGEMVGLLLVHLRHLERVNMSLGYEAGNEALAELAARLNTGFAQRDHVARIGARTFAIILRRLKSASHALLAAGKAERLAQEPFTIAGREVSMSVAQGIALYPDHAKSPAQWLQCAELALNRARDSGESIVMYDALGATQMRQSLRIENELAQALRESRIEPYFQAQVDIKSGMPVGAEALLRCLDSSGSFIAPNLVIEAAERTHRLQEVTMAMMNAALRYAAEWPLSRSDRPPRVSVNVSPTSLKSPDFVDLVAGALSIWGNAPETLCIEITESVFLDEPERGFEAMRRLRALGTRVALDDFGTGYSSLSYFRDIPANELKVDKSFVLGMRDSRANCNIVRAVVDLAHVFDLEVVAEGVEDDATSRMLAELGCDFAQGFWYAKPMAPPDFSAWLSAAGERAP